MGHPIYHHNVFVATHAFGHMKTKSMVTHCCTNEPKTTFIHTRKSAIYETNIAGHLMIG